MLATDAVSVFHRFAYCLPLLFLSVVEWRVRLCDSNNLQIHVYVTCTHILHIVSVRIFVFINLNFRSNTMIYYNRYNILLLI